MNDEFRFQDLGEAIPGMVWAPDDTPCVWAWVEVSSVRIGVVWACPNGASGFLANPAADGQEGDFAEVWLSAVMKANSSMREEDGTFDAILFVERISSRSQMFVEGEGRYSVEELKEALEMGTL